MNYCTKCQSYYERPGTCNCYAAKTVEIIYPQTPGRVDTTAAPYCPKCGGYHVGPCMQWTSCTDLSPDRFTNFDDDHADIRNFHLRGGT